MKKRGGKYGWIQPGVRVRILHSRGEFQHNANGTCTLYFCAADCDTGVVVRTWRKHGARRWVEIKFDPPNYGKTIKLATDVERVAD